MKCPSLSHLTNVSLKSTLCDISYCYSCLFCGQVNLYPAFHTKSVFASVNKMGLLNNRLSDLPFYPVCHVMSFDEGVESIDIQC
jgi:hypothetical protein